jgi:outer membrane protein assembly factor BamB
MGDDTTKIFAYLKDCIHKKVFVRGDATHPLTANTGNRSPWMFDFKRVMFDADFLHVYATLFWERMVPSYPFQVGGLESGALPLITALTIEGQRRGFPVNGFYVRKSRKKSGHMNLIEGTITNDPIIIVDDIFQSGKSVRQVLHALREYARNEPCVGTIASVHVILLFDGERARTFEKEHTITLTTLVTIDELRDTLGIVSEEYNTTAATPPLIHATYTPLWRGGIPTSVFVPVLPVCDPLVHDGYVYVGTRGGVWTCLEVATGRVRWTYSPPRLGAGRDGVTTPTICRNQLIFGNADGNVYALDIKTGKRAWVLFEADWVQGSPAASEALGLVFVPLSFGLFKKQGKMVALHAETGKRVWEHDIEAPVGGGVCYDEREDCVYFGTEDGALHALSGTTGKFLWSTLLPFVPKGAPTVDGTTRSVVVSGVPKESTEDERGGVGAYDVDTGAERFLWRDFSFGSYSTPCVHGVGIYITALDGCAYALDRRSGELKWKTDLGARSFASPCAIDHEQTPTICVGANNGRLLELSAHTGDILHTLYLTERILNRPVYDSTSKILVVPTQAQELHAFRHTVMHTNGSHAPERDVHLSE